MVLVHGRIGISELLNSEGQDVCIEKVNEGSLVELVLPPERDKEKAEAVETVLRLAFVQKQLPTLALYKQMCEAYTTSTVLLSQLGVLQRSKRYEATQTTFELFKKNCKYSV